LTEADKMAKKKGQHFRAGPSSLGVSLAQH